jgi:thiol-disulfide isomerase/thioredoxin
MKNVFCFFLTIFFSQICTAQTNQKVVTLVSETRHGRDIFTCYQDRFDDFDFIYFDRDTVTRMLPDAKINLLHPVLMRFNAGGGQYPVYVRPGDTLFINTASNNPNYYRFSNSRHKTSENEFFVSLNNRGLGIGYPDSYGVAPTAITCTRYAEAVYQKYQSRLAILEEVQKSAPLKNDFYSYARDFIGAQYLHALLSPYWDRTHAFSSLPASYVTTINKSFLRKALMSHALVASCSMYRVVATSYVRFMSRDFLDTPDEFRISYRNAADSLKGKTRDYMLFALMKANITNGLTDFRQVYKHFKSTCASVEYIHYVDSLVAKNNGLTSNANLLATSLESRSGEKITWRDILAKNKGNVLYLDLWASWCGPCLREIPFSKKMQDTLSSKPIKFIFITMDTDKAKWLKSMQANELNTPGVQHYLLDAKSDLAIYIKAPPIPRYVLIDREGVPTSLNAARPSDPNALLSITRLLK